MHCARKAGLIWNAVKHVSEENVVRRFAYNAADVERIRLHERTVREAAFRKPCACGLEQCGVDIDCDNMPNNFCDRQRELAVAAAQVHGAHPGFDADVSEHFGRVGPKRRADHCPAGSQRPARPPDMQG